MAYNDEEEHFTLAPLPFETASRYRPPSHLNCMLHEISQNASLALGLSTIYTIYTSMSNGPMMLRNCFIDFAHGPRFGCCATEPGYAGDIGAIEIRLIDFD